MSIISNELFLLNELETKYSSHISYIKDISYNTTGKRDFIEMDFKSIHFDKVPAFYSDQYENTQSTSADTLIYNHENDYLYLIEFKESWPRDKSDSSTDIRLKCYDSIAKLCLFWVNILKKPRKEFFDLKINYYLITRPKNMTNHPSALAALNSTRQVFQLKMLENTVVDQANILVTPKGIYKFLSTITGVSDMVYINKDSTRLTSF
ncbi:hypothetical protein [Acinetobacter baumannii]|uniref:hypothetical protein n=1 Tax=Acinetobacter baumannii TaxID=470 RepID=UPI0008104120|nr:hypothetical protein [Acinetobacter baumannii]